MATSTTATNRKALADALAAATKSPAPSTSRTTTSKIQEALSQNLTEVGWGTGVSPTFESYGERVPSYLDIGRHVSKTGAAGTSSFTNSWMQPAVTYEPKQGRNWFTDFPGASVVRNALFPSFLNPETALFAVGKPLASMAALTDVTADVIRDAWRDGDLNPFDKDSWSLDALGREYERTQNALTDWNRQVGTGLGDSEWNQIYTFGEVLRDQNWLQGDVFGWEGSEISFDWIPVLPDYKQRVSPSGLAATALNIWADPLTGIRNVGKGVELANSLRVSQNAAQRAVAKNAYRKAYTQVLVDEGVELTDDVVAVVDQLAEASTRTFLGTGGAGKVGTETARNLQISMADLVIGGQRYTVPGFLANNNRSLLAMVQDLADVQAGLLTAGRSSVSSAQMNRVGAIAQELGVNKNWQTLDDFRAFVRGMADQGTPVSDQFEYLVHRGIDTSTKSGSLSTTVGWRLTGTGEAGRGIINKLSSGARKILNSNGVRVREGSDFMTEPIAMQFFSTNNPSLDLFLRTPGMFFQRVGRQLGERGPVKFVREKMSGRGLEFKQIVRDGHQSVPLAQRSTPGQVIQAKEALRSMARGTQMSRRATGRFDGMRRGWQDTVLPILRQKLPGVADAELGVLLKQAINGNVEAIDQVGPEAIRITKEFTRELGEEAHRLGGDEFISFLDDWTPRVLTEESAEAIGKRWAANKYTPRGDFANAGFEKARRYVSPEEYKQAFKDFVESKGKRLGELDEGTLKTFRKEFNESPIGRSDEFVGHKFMEPGSKGYTYGADAGPDAIAPDIETQIADIMQVMGMDHALFDANIFTSMNSYSNALAKRTGDAWAETLMLQKGVLLDADGWTTGAYFPNAGQAEASATLRSTSVRVERARKDLINRIRISVEEGELNQAFNDDAIAALEKVLLKASDEEADALAHALGVEKQRLAAERARDTAQKRVDELLEIDAASKAEIESLRAQYAGDDAAFTKAELKRVRKLEEERQKIQDEVLALNMGRNSAKGYQDGLYYAHWDEARNAIGFKFLVERGLTQTFKDIDTARQFVKWYEEEFSLAVRAFLDPELAQARGLPPGQTVEEFANEAALINQAVNDMNLTILTAEGNLPPRVREELMSMVFRHTDSLGNDVNIPVPVGVKAFEDVARIIDQDSVGEWLVLQDIDRFLPGAMGEYKGAPKAVFSALDLADESIEGSLTVLDDILGRASEMGVDLPAARMYVLPTKENLAAANDVLERAARMGELQVQIANNSSAGYGRVAAAMGVRPQPTTFDAPTTQQINDATRLLFSINGKTNLASVRDVQDLNKILNDYADALMRRESELQVAIGASPVGELTMPIPGAAHSDFELVGLPTYVNQKQFQEGYLRGLKDGSQPRMRTTDTIGTIEQNGKQISPEQLFDPDPRNPFAAMELNQRYAYAQSEGRELEFWAMPNGKVYEIDRSTIFDPNVPDPVASAPVANAVYRELGIPVRDIAVEYTPGPLGRDSWVPSNLKQTDLQNHSVMMEGEIAGSKTYIDDMGQPDYYHAWDDTQDLAAWTQYDANSQIGQGFAADLLLGNFAVSREGSMFVDQLGRLSRGDMLDTFGHRGGSWVDDLPRESPAARAVDPDELDLQAQMLDEMVELPEIIETLPTEQFVREGFTLQELIDGGWRTANGDGFSDDYVAAIRGWIDDMTADGIDFSGQFAQQVDNILALRSKYGGWQGFVAQHGDMLGVARRDQAEYMVNFLETRSKELADLTGLNWFEAGSDDLLRSHGVRMGLDPEVIQNTNRDELLHLIRTENGGHGTLKGGPIPHAIQPESVLGRPGAIGGHTWSDGTALNLTLSPVAYGSKFSTIAQDAMVYRQFVLDLSGGGRVRFYGQDPWREEAARQLLLRMGKDPVSDTSTLDDFLNSMEMLGNQASRPYGFIDETLDPNLPMVEGQRIFQELPMKDYAGGPARGFDSGLGEMAVDIFTRLNDDTLDELIGFVSPKQNGMLLAARDAPWDINDDAYFRLAEIVHSKGGPSRVRVSDIPDEKVKMWRKTNAEQSRQEALQGSDEDLIAWMNEQGNLFANKDVYEEVSLRQLWKDIRAEGKNELGYLKEWEDRFYRTYVTGALEAQPRSRTEVYAFDPGQSPAVALPPEIGPRAPTQTTTLAGASRPTDYNFFQASSNAFIEAKSLTASQRFGRYFAQTAGTKRPMQNALEFIGWRDMMLRRSQQTLLGDAALMPSSSDDLETLIFKFFRVTDPEFNPTHYAINQAIASRGAARHSDTMLRGVYERYFQMQARAGHLDELGSFQSFRKATRGKEGDELKEFVSSSSYDALVPRPHLAKTPETSLVARIFNEYHLSLAADGYGGTAWLNNIDDVRWSTYADDLFDRPPSQGGAGVPSEPTSNYFVNVTATNPYVLRPNFDIDNLVSGTPITQMDQVIKDGIVDSRRLIELFEHRAQNVLTSPPANRATKDVLDPLAQAVEAQQVATRTIAEINLEWEKAFSRLDDIEGKLASREQLEILQGVRSAANEKVERLRNAIQILENMRTRPASGVGAEAQASLSTFGAQFEAAGGVVARSGLGEDIGQKVLQGPETQRGLMGVGMEFSADDLKNLEDQVRQLAIGDLAELNDFLDVALADNIGDAIIKLQAAGEALEIHRGLPSVSPKMTSGKLDKGLEEVLERTLRSGIRPVGTRSQGTSAVVDGILAFDTIGSRGGAREFIKKGGYFDKVHNVMKGYMVASMGFLARNAYGGMFMNWMAGVAPTRYQEFMRALMVARVRIAKEAAGEAPLTGAMKQLEKRTRNWNVPEEHISYVRILEDQGAFGGTQAGIEFDTGGTAGRTVTVAGKTIPLKLFSPISSKFFPLQAVRGANVHVETMLRGTLGLDRMIKHGGQVDAAFDDIWKYHFNYDDLSRFERSGIKRATSFYTWMRHALPLVAQSYYKNPTLWQRYVQGMSTVADEDAKGWDEMAPWLRRQGAVPIGWEYKGNNLTFSPDVPIRSFFDMVSPIFEKDKSVSQRLGISESDTGGVLTSGLSMLNPMLKAPAEYVTKRNFWKGYNYDGSFERVPNQLTMVPGLMEAMSVFFGGGSDPKMYYDEEGEFWGMEDALLASTFQLLPPLNTLRRLVPDEKRFKERAVSSWVSWLSGAGIRTNTDWEIEKTRRNEIYRQLGEIDTIEDKLRLRAETRAGLN